MRIDLGLKNVIGTSLILTYNLSVISDQNCDHEAPPTHRHPAPPHQTGSCHQTCSDLQRQRRHVKLTRRMTERHTRRGLKGAASSLTVAAASRDGQARRVALALHAVLEHGLLQLLHLPLLPLALLQPALLLRFAQMLLQGELAGRLVNLPLESQVSFQRLQLGILPHKRESRVTSRSLKLFPFPPSNCDEVKQKLAPLCPGGSDPRPI